MNTREQHQFVASLARNDGQQYPRGGIDSRVMGWAQPLGLRVRNGARTAPRTMTQTVCAM